LIISNDKHVTLIDPKSGRKINNFTDIFKDYVWNLAISHDGTMIAALEKNRFVVWDIATGAEITSVDAEGFTNPPMYFPDIFFSTDNKTLYTANNKGILTWDVKTGKRTNTITVFADSQIFIPEKISLLDDGRLISATTNQTLIVLDLNTQKKVHTSYYFSGVNDSFSLSNTNEEFVTVRKDNDTVAVYDLTTGQIKNLISGLSKPYFARYSPLGNYLSVFDSKGGHIYETGTYTEICESAGSFYSQDETFFSFQFEGKLYINSLPRCNITHTFRLPPDKAHMFLTDDFEYLMEAKLDGTINLFNVETENIEKTFIGFPSDYPLVKASNDNKYIAQYDDRKTWIWDLKTGSKIKEMSTGSPTFVGHLVYTPSRLLINIWDLDANKALSPVTLPIDKNATVSPDGKLIAMSGYDYKKGVLIYVIDTTTSKILYRYSGHTKGVFPIFDIEFVFSSDSQKMISIGDDGSVLLWDTSH
jgi:WD40 repeat protein